MADWTIYYNPKCGSCRNALEILTKKKIKPRIVEYLKETPSEAELERLVSKLGADAVIRTKEEAYKKHAANPPKNAKAWAKAIAADPILLQRPIIVTGERAVVARPPEKVLELF